MIHDFIWCDVSTFKLKAATSFYKKVFGWYPYKLESRSDNEDYTLFFSGDDAAAGVFTMPQYLQDLKMPSFWMSYVQVASVEQSADLAVQLGAKCEIKPTAADPHSKYALIRDPSGAGFTLYEGEDLKGRDVNGKHGRMAWNALHVPDIGLVDRFYRELFGWEIAQDPEAPYLYDVRLQGESIASILVHGEETKGPKNYWLVYFTVDDLTRTMKKVVGNGGSVLAELKSHGKSQAIVEDDQSAAFVLVEK